MISNYHWTCRASRANYGFMITCRLPSHQSDKHSNGVLAETSPTCLFPTPFSILSFVLSRHHGRGKNSHAWIMNVSSRLLGEASDTYQFSIFPCHLSHSICIHQTTGTFSFLHQGGIERMSKCLGTDSTETFPTWWSLIKYNMLCANDLLFCLTCPSRLDADWLEAAVKGRGIYDVRVEVAMVLAVHK